MPEEMTEPEETAEHVWVGASTVELDLKQAHRAVLRHSIRIPEQTKIDVLEVYCSACRRPWDDVAGEPCLAASTTEHLRGGPIGERKKRGHRHNCAVLGCETGPAVGPGPVPAAG